MTDARTYTRPHASSTYKIAYQDWGPEDANPIVCVHGLTGNAFDFDILAQDLTQHGHRLIAVDLPGRGDSDFHDDPLLYNYDQYIQDLLGLLDHLHLKSVDWLGVSLGGLLGVRIAGSDNSPIRRMILNDIGPEVPKAALDFIHMVIAQDYSFADMDEFEHRLRETRGLSWGPMRDEHWAHMAKYNARPLDDGRLTYKYDPKIAVVFEKEPIGAFDLWSCWDAITCPMLVIQGGQSVLLTDEIIKTMQAHRPKFDLHVFEDCGHVPSLMDANQIQVLRSWLQNTPIS